MAILIHLWPFLKPERNRLLQNAAVTLGLTAAEVATPILVGMFLDSLLTRLGGTVATTPPPVGQSWIIALLALGALGRGWLLSKQEGLSGRTGEQVAARIRNALWRHVQTLPLEYTRRRGPGRMLVRFISDTRAIQRLVTRGLIQVSQDILMAVGMLTALVVLNQRLALVVLLILPIYWILFGYLNPKLRKESRAARRRRGRLSAYLGERLVGMAIVKAYVRQPHEAVQIRELNRQLAKRGTRRAEVGGQLIGSASGIVAGTTALVLLLAGREAEAGRLTAGTLVTFYTLMLMLVPVFERVVRANRYFQEAHISVERLVATLAESPESPADCEHPPLIVEAGEIELRDVSFGYGEGKASVTGVTLTARRGEVVAFAGPNGAGKSTLIELILRFRERSGGAILIDGQDISEVSLASLRSCIGLVTQDALLFDGTVAENVTYGLADDVSSEQVARAAVMAGVDDFVGTLPEGWNTRVGTGGSTLSGGQRQRIALARALALDPPILVLDEATSALDAETEQELAAALQELAKEKTVVVVAHRLPTLRAADRIYVLEGGRIVESGAHDALIGKGGAYARLYGELDRTEAVGIARVLS